MEKIDKAKIEYLEEHIPYELLMLRRTYQQMNSCTDQLDWNAFFESFCLHGRNLYNFLRNDRDNRSFKASDFADGYRPPKPLAGIMQKVAQVAHIGKERTKDPTGKVDLSRCTKLFEWIERHWPDFEAAIKPEYRAYWNPALAQPPKVMATDLVSPRGPTGPTTTTASSAVYVIGPFRPR